MTTRDEALVETLPDYRAWLYKQAYNLTARLNKPGLSVDDLAQEGHIAMWRALDSYRPDLGSLTSWLTTRARDRMLAVALQGRRWFGDADGSIRTYTTADGDATRERIRAHLRDHPTAGVRDIATALGLAPSTVSRVRKDLATEPTVVDEASLQELLDLGFDPADAADTLAAVLDGYHHGEIVAAIDRLTAQQRRYVVLRFWHGLTTAELTREFGRDPRGIWRDARDRLAEDLAHLDPLGAAA